MTGLSPFGSGSVDFSPWFPSPPVADVLAYLRRVIAAGDADHAGLCAKALCRIAREPSRMAEAQGLGEGAP